MSERTQDSLIREQELREWWGRATEQEREDARVRFLALMERDPAFRAAVVQLLRRDDGA